MRTKVLKLGMPFLAFLLAIVFAFASEKSPAEDEYAAITGYISTTIGCIPAPKDCALEGSVVCKYNNQLVHANPDCGPIFLWERMH